VELTDGCNGGGDSQGLPGFIHPLCPWDTHYQFPIKTLLSSLYVPVRETGDWDLFLGPLEWARAETGGADRRVL